MISKKLAKIWYGGDYNPDQWGEDIWKEDIRLFKMAGIDVTTLPVFSWGQLQPSENRFDFDKLDKIIEGLSNADIYLCMATSTGAMPAWLAKAYPEVLRVNESGLRRTYGERHNHCPSSPVFREKSKGLARQLALRYGKHDKLLLWHVSNEYGGYCYCDLCEKSFRVWLQNRYESLENLNDKWTAAFWSHTFHAWDEIPVPNYLNEVNFWGRARTSFQAMVLDYYRFQSWSLLQSYLAEVEVLRSITPDVPITTNMMGTYKWLNYKEWAPHVDVVSWDSYPFRGYSARNAMRHDLMRSIKGGKPFMLMEQTPNQVNWSAQNRVRLPGEMRMWSYQAIAHGADTVMFFQLRRSRGSGEKLHGAVIDHCGHENTRIFRECAALGHELEKLGSGLLDSRIKSKVAIVFDWENWWALDLSNGPNDALNYPEIVERFYKAFWDMGLSIDVINPDDDFSPYQVIAAPLLYMCRDGLGTKAEAFVKAGGHFLTTCFSGIVDENDRIHLGGYPAPLRKLLGIWAEEMDALPPGESRSAMFTKDFGNAEFSCELLCDIIHSEGAEVLAKYTEDFFAGHPVLTRNNFGSGKAWNLASFPKEQSVLNTIVGQICREANVTALLSVPPEVEVVQRSKDGQNFLFILNHNRNKVSVSLGEIKGRDLLSGQVLQNDIELQPFGLVIIQRPA